MSNLTRLSLSIEKPLFEKLEALVEQGDYSNRSEFVRDLIRDHIVEKGWAGDEEMLGTIFMVYDHHVRELAAKLTHEQHHFTGHILATTHIHLDEKYCAEMIMIKGLAADIEKLVNHMRREKGVLQVRLAMGSAGNKLA